MVLGGVWGWVGLRGRAVEAPRSASPVARDKEAASGPIFPFPLSPFPSPLSPVPFPFPLRPTRETVTPCSVGRHCYHGLGLSMTCWAGAGPGSILRTHAHKCSSTRVLMTKRGEGNMRGKGATGDGRRPWRSVHALRGGATASPLGWLGRQADGPTGREGCGLRRG